MEPKDSVEKTLREMLSRRQLVVAGGGFLLLNGALGLVGCGGGGGSRSTSTGGGTTGFPTAGSVVFTKTTTVSSTGATLSDTGGIASVTVPAGAMTTGSTIQLDEYSQQRSIATLPSFTPSANAVDITLIPASLGSNSIVVAMPGSGTDEYSTILTAFGPTGSHIALPSTTDSTTGLLKGYLSASIISYLLGVPATYGSAVKIQVVVQTVKAGLPSSRKSITPSGTVSKSASAKTIYASRQRIGITIHGIFASAADIQTLTTFVGSVEPTDGLATQNSNPFDSVVSFDYDWSQPIATTGQAFATYINTKYGDTGRFDVHIFAHSMGGLIARYAVETVGCPTVSQLVTIATPHLGMPKQVVKNLLVFYDALFASNVVSVGFAQYQAGVEQLVQNSAVLQTLSNNTAASQVTYEAIAGTTADLQLSGVTIGAASDTLYQFIGTTQDDGLVSYASATGGKAPAPFVSVPYNHDALIGSAIDTYWSQQASKGWIVGMNREIAKLIQTSTPFAVNVGTTAAVALIAEDKDGAELNAALMFSATAVPQQPALTWTAADPTVVAILNPTRLTATLSGLKPGSTTITIKDPTSGTTLTIPTTVTSTPLTLTPSNANTTSGSTVPFKLALPTGYAVPTGAGLLFDWSETGGGTGASLNDGAGKSGASIETAGMDVDLITSTAMTGTISVTVNAYEVTATTKLLIGTVTTSVYVTNPFAGSYSGTYTAEVTPPETGTIKWTISSTGAITGSGANSTIGFTFQIAGAIDGAGNLSGTFGTGVTMGGNLTLDANHDLIGSIKSTQADGTFFLNQVNLAPTTSRRA